MNFNDELILLTPVYEQDAVGNDNAVDLIKKPILCEVKSTVRAVYYDYGNNEHHPEYVVTVNKCEYDGEGFCYLRDKQYTIVRTYELDRDLLELTLEVTNHIDEFETY